MTTVTTTTPSGDAVEITQIREELIDSFHAALDAVARESRLLSFLEAPPIEWTRAFVTRNIANDYPQLLALDAARVVGWCDVTPADRPVLRHAGVVGMGLLSAYRGRGLGERLLRQALDAARAFGFLRVELSVRADNQRALALYQRLGFAVEGRKRKAVLVDGVLHDLLIMGLLFDECGEVSDRKHSP